MKEYVKQNYSVSFQAVVFFIFIFQLCFNFVGCAGDDSEQGESIFPSYEDKPSLANYYEPFQNTVDPQAPGYDLPLDINSIQNYEYMDSLFDLESLRSLLEQYGFAISEFDLGQLLMDDYDNADLVAPYAILTGMNVPIFVTADTLLHLYHIQFDETLKEAEENEFITDIKQLTVVLLDDAQRLYDELGSDLREAARRNIAYLAVALALIDPDCEIPALVAPEVNAELQLIYAHQGFSKSIIFIYREDYSQYVPRGHYTRSEDLERYFRTMMWYGRMAFLLKGAENWGDIGDALISEYDARIQTMQAVLLATSLNSVQVNGSLGRSIWDRIYAITSFYVGLADDLTPYEYLGALNEVFGNTFTLNDLLDEDKFYALKVELSLLPSPEIYGGTGNIAVVPPLTPDELDEVLDKTKGMRFMGQRFIPDSYIFQHLVFPEVLDYTGNASPPPFTYGYTGVRYSRCYPRGLDVMAILGATEAYQILVSEGDTAYHDYDLRFEELQTYFEAFDIYEWNRNLYWSWLYTLRSLIGEFPEGYPSFMRTKAWTHKELNTALASWTELRHDTILYAKPTYTPWEYGIPEVRGYVEPVPEFYGRLLALIRMTKKGLSDYNVLSTEAEQRLLNLESVLERLISLVNKELTNQAFSQDDNDFLLAFGSYLQDTILGVDDIGCKTTLVADVHTHTFEGLVLEEGVGLVDLIFVACPTPDGSIFLSAGPVFSYYEFKQPMSDRLTDEAWQVLLTSEECPSRPPWFQYLVRESK
ncbi:DUF3160 domain-containing protein [candidate division CSSED10-310 bacterium]|uniref:DUF3160 domain-containing protein n=1 Tax=candidate division CSSED10-310 bacterium TaxID=2855610 RepID=A0ABV6YS52_UNCC1